MAAHIPTVTMRPAPHIASAASPQVSGLIHGLARRRIQRSRRPSGHSARRDGGILRSGSVLSGNSTTSPMIRYTKVPAWRKRNAVSRKKLLPASDWNAVQSRR